MSVLKKLRRRRTRHERPAVLRGEKLQSLNPFLPLTASVNDAPDNENNHERDKDEREKHPEKSFGEPHIL